MEVSGKSYEYEIAEILGFKKDSFAARKSRGSIPEKEIKIACVTNGWPYEWVISGEGEMRQSQPRQLAAVQAESVAAEQAVNDYRGSASRMAVVEIKRPISEDGWALLDSFELLCDEQKKSLLIVAQTMALGVPTKSPPKGPSGKS